MTDDRAPVPDAIFEQAVIRQARLREPDTTAADRAAHASWLAADPLHAQADAEARDLWAATAVPAARLAAERATAPTPMRPTLMRPTPVRARRPFGRPVLARLAAAASLLLAVAAGAVWGPVLVDRLRADHATAVGERRAVTLADGSRVWLNTDTALAVAVTAHERRVRLLRGQAFFEVVPDAARPFVVATGAGSARVVGTAFDMRVDGGRAVVAVLAGRVVAAPPGDAGHDVKLAAGERAVLADGAASGPEPVDADAVAAWRQGRIVFYRAPLADVVAELDRHRRGRILPLSARLGEMRVTGAFDAARPDDALDVIAATLSVEVRRLPFGFALLR